MIPNLCRLSHVGGLTKIRQKPCQVKNKLFCTFLISSEQLQSFLSSVQRNRLKLIHYNSSDSFVARLLLMFGLVLPDSVASNDYSFN